jgi:DNA-directed RNA polymerase specialized sigma54-like protein
MLNQSLSQKQTQKTLPKIIMQQNILAIPLLSLDNIIKRELELNPMLEEEVNMNRKKRV